MIQSAEYLCLYAGGVLFALGIITLFIKQSWRLGIILILLSDIPLAVAVAFPKILAQSFMSMGINFDDTFAKVTGSSIAVVTFVVLFYLYHKFFKFIFYKKSVNKKDSENSKENTSETDSKAAAKEKTNNPDIADPSIFANVSYKKD